MGTGSLVDRSSGQVITAAFFNSIHSAMNGDFVGRNSSGVATANQNLGTAALPWGAARVSSLVVGGSSVDVSQVASPPFRIVSGKTRSTSNQPAFITPAGAAGGLAFDIKAAATDLVFEVNGVSVTLSADLTKSAITAAPSSNNTALVNDADAADGEKTRTWGEPGAEKESITIGTVGSEIATTRLNTYQAFSINDGANTEIFLAYIASATSLSRIHRGYFYDSSLAPVNRIKFADGDTITLLQAHWVFLEDDASTVDVTTNAPVYAFDEPGSPASGDYWYDMGNDLWKRYNGSSFATVDRTFMGVAVTNTADCLYARCEDFDVKWSPHSAVALELLSTTVVQASGYYQNTDVDGFAKFFGTTSVDWDIATDLATGSSDLYAETEQASTYYYLYIKDDGDIAISDISPYWEPKKYAHYHPHNPWRCVGLAYNDGSSNLVSTIEADHFFVSSPLIVASYKTNAGQTINASSTAVIDYEDLVKDSHGLVTTGASWNFKCPTTGYYFVKAVARMAYTAATNFFFLSIRKNGTVVKQQEGSSPGTALDFGGGVSGVVFANRGDTIDITFQNTTGSNETLIANGDQNYVDIMLLKTGAN